LERFYCRKRKLKEILEGKILIHENDNLDLEVLPDSTSGLHITSVQAQNEDKLNLIMSDSSNIESNEFSYDKYNIETVPINSGENNLIINNKFVIVLVKFRQDSRKRLVYY
jgi:hypothetical protein